jgi:hypothetical protein
VVNGRTTTNVLDPKKNRQKPPTDYHPNRLQHKRLEHHAFYHLASSTVPSYYFASLCVELGVARDITSGYLEVQSKIVIPAFIGIARSLPSEFANYIRGID